MDKSLVIYDGEKGEVVFDVDKNGETIWATQAEMATIFGVDRTVISRHLRNIFKDGELEEDEVCWMREGTSAKNAHVVENTQNHTQACAKSAKVVNGRVYEAKLYNLDAIISVGYRVNSKKATKFRKWATRVLKQYIVGGVAVNGRRLKQLSDGRLAEIEGALGIVKRLLTRTELEEGEAKGVLEVIAKYGGAMEVLKDYDDGKIPAVSGKQKRERRELLIGDVLNLVENLREELGERGEFGEFRREGEFEKKVAQFEGSVARRAVLLLYYVVKERPFLDGNRRIGALLFIYYLTINGVHLAENGETKISDRALTAIVLLMAESKEGEKELMCGVVEKLLE